MAKSNYRLAAQAIADLEQIADYLAARSPSAADRVVEELFRCFDALASNAAMGTSLHELRADLHMIVPARPAANYLIFFYRVPDGIMVSAVIHAARDWVSMFARGER